MIFMSTLGYVRDNPCPSLDEEGPREQLGAYQEALTNFIENQCVTVLTIPAGAGSGKTRTLVATIIGLLRIGIPPENIESISFTNASADDFQKKLISELAKLTEKGSESLQIANLGFSTIHKHAVDLLKKLEPHVGGVAYYFEDSEMSGDVNSPDRQEQSAKEKAIKLAFYASIYFGNTSCDLIDALMPFIEKENSEERFILSNIKSGDHRQEAENFICRDFMSDAGLGAFTNVDDTDPDFCLAVATDALLRLHSQTIQHDRDEKQQIFGLPAYLMVDEAQDLDLIQLLYLRALALNGVSILMVGDPRQTLYEFRNSVSEWPFDSGFMSALFAGTGVKARISKSPLLTNYRSRNEIIELAEGISQKFVEYSQVSSSKNVKKIYDPSESVKPSHYYKSDIQGENRDKLASAIRFIEGAKTDQLDLLKPEPKRKANSKKLAGALGRLAKRQDVLTKSEDLLESNKALKRKLTHIQIPNLCGGDNQADIESCIFNLYERAKKGESVAILTRNGQKPEDIRYLLNVLKKRYKDIENPSSLRLDQINSEKNAPLSSYWYLGIDQQANCEVPFSSVLISAAIHYFFSWDKEASDEVRNQGMKEFNAVIPSSTTHEAIERNFKYAPEASISIELNPFVSALIANASDFFPYVNSQEIIQQKEALVKLLARFVISVLMQYSVVLWERSKGSVYTHQPCRFQSVAIVWDRTKGSFKLRPLSKTKRYFKMFWQALVNTPFQLSIDDRALIERCGLSPEWMNVSTTLLNYPEELINWKDDIERHGGSIDSVVKSRQDDFIKQREVIHEQFSKLYHHKTRTYLREIAKQVGRLIRLDPSSSSDYVLLAGYEHFRAARQKARLSTWKKEGRNKTSFAGLFEDFQTGLRDINLKSRPKTKNNVADEKIPIITMSTIHSSKGLEWDHVLLFFPQATNRDKNSSFKSIRDLLYVAITRAKRTLTVVIGSDKNYKEVETNTGMLVAKHVVSDYAREQGLFERTIELNSLVIEDNEKQKEPDVELQTSHSELEKALSCRLHHYIQHSRNLSSMVPLTAPSYSFFFHTAMSSICAAFIGQRLPIPDDPVMLITRVIDSLANKSDITEHQVYESLMKNAEQSINELMQSMIPMYFLSEGDDYYEVMTYYSHNFANQLASIIVGSKLFQNLATAKRLDNHQIWIEKPIKDVRNQIVEGTTLYLPILGIPDIKIAGPQINYVCDYKTVATPLHMEGELDGDTLLHISEKTFIQLNLYQGLLNRVDSDSYVAEIIYVPDISVMEGDEIPVSPPPLPKFNNDAQFRVRANLRSAVILWTEQFDKKRFDDTIDKISDLRFQTNVNLEHLSGALFCPAPLVGEYSEVEVTIDTCHRCPSAVHCQKYKKEI